MNIYTILIVALIIGKNIFDLFVERLNIKSASEKLPDEFKSHYDDKKYRKSQRYLREKTIFELYRNTFFTLLLILLIFTGAFNYIDKLAGNLGAGQVTSGLIFAGILAFSAYVADIPFSIYKTFGIEQKYGFNRTTPATFISDLLKGLIIMAILGGGLFAGIVWFFSNYGRIAWFYAWIFYVLFQIIISIIAPRIILPLFNRYEPLKKKELREAIEDFSEKQGFKIKDIYQMDGSKRSSKSNAFFTGIGRNRRVVLFDTLIEKHSVNELVAVLAHEIGHFKKKHIIKYMVVSSFFAGLMFFLLSLFITATPLFHAFGVEQASVYAGIIFFGFIYAPISVIISVLRNYISRRNEVQADFYAVKSSGQPQALISALKKLSVNNMVNLTPHPLKVKLHYSHPPVLERIKYIKDFVAAAPQTEG